MTLLLPPYTFGGLVGRVVQADAFNLLRWLPDASISLIATDPPYNGVKDDEWDNQWATDADYLKWLDGLLVEFKRVLKPNGSLYLFASPRMAARVEVAVSKRFNVVNRITWKKPMFSTKAEMFDKDTMRGYFPSSEAILFAEQVVANESYTSTEYALNGQVYAPLKEWFRSRAKACGITAKAFNTALGVATNGSGLAGSYFGDKIEFQLPTAERYQQMQSAFPDAFDSPYADLRREYEDLRREYEDLRRPFNASEYRPYTDVWEFKTVNTYEGKHPCEKPLALMEHIILTSSRPGDVVLDCFAGSGTTGDAASRNGRKYILSDADPHWTRYAEKRLTLPYTVPMFATLDAQAAD